MESKSFGVTSKFFSVYQAFKTEAEEIGVIWNTSFNPFEARFMNRRGIFITRDWHRTEDGKVRMSFSNFTENIIDLDTNFKGAIERVQSLVAAKEMTLEEIEKVLGHKVIIVNS